MKKINSPLFFGTLYLVLIPIYALIYSSLPSNFYQSTKKVEEFTTGFKKSSPLKQEIYYDLLNAIADNYQSAYKSSFDTLAYFVPTLGIKGKGSKSYSTQVSPSLFKYPQHVEINDNWMTFDILYVDKDDSMQYILPMKVNIQGEHFFSNQSNSSQYREMFTDIDSSFFQDEKRGMKLLQLFPMGLKHTQEFSGNEFSKPGGYKLVGYINISKSLQYKINALTFDLNGVPSTTEFGNMLYLSIVTITTLGYGDFVPITNKARLLVSSEALLGIVVIGLFLNSLVGVIKKI